MEGTQSLRDSNSIIWVLSPKPADYTVVEYRTKEKMIYICMLSSDLQHVDNLVVSDQLVFPNK